jgi:hypothetical protein
VRSGYAWASAALLVAVALHHAEQHWAADFWEHAAVVRELSLRPTSPSHPLLGLDAPHVFFSPYGVALGGLARLSGASGFTALGAAALFNLLLLVWALRWFVRGAFPSQSSDRTASLALGFVVLLWGWAPWSFSGFFHLDALLYAASYPSTFAFGLSLAGLGAAARYLEAPHPGWLAALGLSAAIVLLVHPLTSAFLGALLLGLAVGAHPSAPDRLRRGSALAAAACLGAGLASLWPCYSLLDLLRFESGEFHDSNRQVYVGLRTLSKLGPALLGLAPLALWARRQPRHPLVVALLPLLLLIALGWITERYAYGRALSHVAVVLQLALAVWINECWEDLTRWPVRERVVNVLRPASVAAVALACVVFHGAVGRLLHSESVDHAGLASIAERVGEREVVLADPHTSWRVPAYAGRVVASRHPLAFVPDQEQRRLDLARFFAPGTPAPEREQLALRYEASWVLINAEVTVDPEELLASLAGWTRLEASDGPLTLLRVVVPAPLPE